MNSWVQPFLRIYANMPSVPSRPVFHRSAAGRRDAFSAKDRLVKHNPRVFARSFFYFSPTNLLLTRKHELLNVKKRFIFHL